MYDSLARLVYALADDNGIRTLPRDQWQWPTNVKLLDDCASVLTTDDDVEAFVAGEYDESQLLTNEHNLQTLNQWVEAVFNREPSAGKYYTR